MNHFEPATITPTPITTIAPRNAFLIYLMKKEHLIIITAVLVFTLVVLGAATFLRAGYLGSSLLEQMIVTQNYQAVTLEDDKVYFGKIVKGDAEFLTLKNVYLLEPGATKILKHENEVYGPTDTIILNKQKVLLIENLDPAGQAMKAIESYRSKNKINKKQNPETTQKQN